MAETWTRERVCALLVAEFRGSGLFAASPGEVDRGLNWRQRFLAADREGWTYLTEWARCRATGESIAARLRERRFARRAFEEGWRRAADAIAAGLSGERVNTARLLAGSDAETGSRSSAGSPSTASRRSASDA